MPIFIFNKLVRDKLPQMYTELNQRIIFRKVSGIELLNALRSKLIEESAEIPFEDGNRDEIINELSDVYQVLDDIKTAQHISDDEIETAKQAKLAKKGGFSDATFVESIELDDSDEWVEYYRREPEKYKESM